MKKMFLVMGLAVSFQLCADLTIADGKTSGYVIVIPDGADRTDTLNGMDLQKHLQTITGVKLPMLKESWPRRGKAVISVGATKMAKEKITFGPNAGLEEMVVKTVGKDLFLFGSSQIGTGFAVYEFLEKVCGCRWFDRFNRVIPKKPKLVIPELDIRRKPSFEYRAMHCSLGSWVQGDPSIGLSLKATHHRIANPVYGRPRAIHSFYNYCKDWPKNKLYLLAKGPNGRRQALRGNSGPNFCMTQPEAVQLFGKKLREFIAQDRKFCTKYKIPFPYLYNITQNDCTSYYCCCDKCQAIVKKHGQSGLLLYFINQVANDIAKDHPEILIQTAAYSFSLEPPKGIKAAPNVCVEIMHTIGNYYSPVEADDTVPFRDYITAWGKAASMIGIWDYWIFYWDTYPAPYHNVHQIKKDLSFYYRNRARTMRIESEAPDTASFFVLKAWLGYKLMDDLSQDDTKLIDEFMKGYYGPAAAEIKEFYNYMIERQKGQNTKIFIPVKMHYKTPDRVWLDAEFYRRAEDIFNRAEAKCAPGSMALKNVHRERIPVDLSLLNIYDKIKPAIARDVLAKRYYDNACEQVKLRKKPTVWPVELLRLRNEYEKFKRADEIAGLKKGPRPQWKIGPKWSTIRLEREMSGVPTGKKITAQGRYDKKNLYLRLTEKDFLGKLKEGQQPYQGDDWEIFFADEKKDQYLQLMIAPSGRFEVLHKKGAGQWIKIREIQVKSVVKGQDWTVDVTIPPAALPLKNIRYGNFVRGISQAGVAWSPTFSVSYGVPEFFGKLILE